MKIRVFNKGINVLRMLNWHWKNVRNLINVCEEEMKNLEASLAMGDDEVEDRIKVSKFYKDPKHLCQCQ